MSELVGKVHTQFKKTSGDLALFCVKLVSGAILGLTFALIMQVVLGHGDGEAPFAFLLMIVVTTGIFLRLAKSWGFTAILIFDLICVLLGLVLRLYIMVAPEA
jgi:hypothetical protein